MPWDNSDYPDSFKNLEPEVRRKAIEIANALLREGYEESRAISISMTKAREYVHGTDDKRPHYEVKPQKEDWVLMKEDGEKAIFKEQTKMDLLDKSKPYVNDKNGVLSVYHEDGSLEQTLYK